MWQRDPYRPEASAEGFGTRRDANRHPQATVLLSEGTMTADIRFAARQLRNNPGFSAIAIITLAVGIGAAAAIFGLIQGALLSPPPYRDPARLILISPIRTDGRPYTRSATIGQWLSWRQAQSIEPPAMYRWTFNFLVLPDGSASMGGMVVTPGFFRVLGLRPVLGREFVPVSWAAPIRRQPPSSSATTCGSASSTAILTSSGAPSASVECRQRSRWSE